jgi:copper chaperone CopZ
MHCGACAARIEHALGRVPGVASASVNLATARAFVSYNGSAVSAGELCQTVVAGANSADRRHHVTVHLYCERMEFNWQAPPDSD